MNRDFLQEYVEKAEVGRNFPAVDLAEGPCAVVRLLPVIILQIDEPQLQKTKQKASIAYV